MRFLAILSIGVVAVSIAASADTLLLQNGDRLSGTLGTIQFGTLSFRTELAGKIFVPVEEVAGISTANLVVLDTADGALPLGRLQYSEEGIFLEVSGPAEPIAVDLGAITGVTIAPPMTQSEVEPPNLALRPLSRTLETGFNWESAGLRRTESDNIRPNDDSPPLETPRRDAPATLVYGPPVGPLSVSKPELRQPEPVPNLVSRVGLLETTRRLQLSATWGKFGSPPWQQYLRASAHGGTSERMLGEEMGQLQLRWRADAEEKGEVVSRDGVSN